MASVSVLPKSQFLAWTGSNLAEIQEFLGTSNVWTTPEGLFYGSSIGPFEIGGGFVRGGVGRDCRTAQEFSDNFVSLS